MNIIMGRGSHFLEHPYGPYVTMQVSYILLTPIFYRNPVHVNTLFRQEIMKRPVLITNRLHNIHISEESVIFQERIFWLFLTLFI